MKKTALLLFAVSAFAASVSATAASWLYHGPKNDVVNLIVTANYDQPRLLADLIQTESRQPILFVPAVGKKGSITFCPPVRRGKPLVIEEEKLTNFITYLKPKRIIVLGDERFVEAKYLKLLGKSAPIFVASDNDWLNVANSLSPMLNITYLGSDFAKLRPKVAAMGKSYIPLADLQNSGAVEKPEVAPVQNSPEAAPAVEPPPAVDTPAPASDSTPAASGKDLEPELLPGSND